MSGWQLLTAAKVSSLKLIAIQKSWQQLHLHFTLISLMEQVGMKVYFFSPESSVDSEIEI